jgi:uncharacterized protein (DUF983 family)
MTSQCPRCGTPRLDVYPICSRCGFDFRSAGAPANPAQQLPPAQPIYGAQPYGQPAAQPQPQGFGQPPSYGQQASFGEPQPPSSGQSPSYGQPPSFGQSPSFGQPPSYGQPRRFGEPLSFAQPVPPPTPSVCPRCYSQIAAGYTQCGNCGYDTRASWSAARPAPQSRDLMMPIALALVGISVLVAACSIYVIAQHKGGSATGASPAPSAIVESSPTSALTLRPTGASTSPHPSASASRSVDSADSPEPSPPGTWTKYNSPDGKWSASFPGTSSPTVSTTTVGSGSSGNAKMYLVDVGSTAEYAVWVIDLPASEVSGRTSTELLDSMESILQQSFTGADEIKSVATTEAGYPARDVMLETNSATIDYRMWFVGNRFYALLAACETGSLVYPRHFFAAFSLK